MSELPKWVTELAQRVVDNNTGQWLTDTWVVAVELLQNIDGSANDGHYELVALLIDTALQLEKKAESAITERDAARRLLAERDKEIQTLKRKLREEIADNDRLWHRREDPEFDV